MMCQCVSMQEPIAADEWQLSWSAGALHAGELLPNLRVNPTSALQHHGLAQLAVPFTLAVEAQALDVSLLGFAAAEEAHSLEQLGRLQCTGLKVRVRLSFNMSMPDVVCMYTMVSMQSRTCTVCRQQCTSGKVETGQHVDPANLQSGSTNTMLRCCGPCCLSRSWHGV